MRATARGYASRLPSPQPSSWYQLLEMPMTVDFRDERRVADGSCILAFSLIKWTWKSTMRSIGASNRPQTARSCSPRTSGTARPSQQRPRASYSFRPLWHLRANRQPRTPLHPTAYRLSSIQTHSRTHTHTYKTWTLYGTRTHRDTAPALDSTMTSFGIFLVLVLEYS
jgi:hypothetical protein